MRPGHDGVTRVLYQLVDYLVQHRIEHEFFSPIVPTLDELHTRFHAVPSVVFPLYKDYKFALPGMRHFEEELVAFDPDIIHINSPCPLGYAAVSYGRRYRVPVVATYHTHFASYAKYYNIGMLEALSWKYIRSLYNKCQRVFVPSQPIVDELVDRGLNSVEFLPHGVDTNAFNPRFRSVEWRKQVDAESKHILLFAGRLVWEKDLRTLAETYRLLTAKRNDIVFVLAGDGPSRAELSHMMPDARFLGHQSKSDLATAYASSDVFVFPSTTETFGNVTLEAMASALPPVCAREGGAYGIIDHGHTGLVAAPRCPYDLADNIESLLDSPERRESMSGAALHFAQQQQWDNIFDRLFQSYDDVIREYSYTILGGSDEPAVHYRPSLRPAH